VASLKRGWTVEERRAQARQPHSLQLSPAPATGGENIIEESHAAKTGQAWAVEEAGRNLAKQPGLGMTKLSMANSWLCGMKAEDLAESLGNSLANRPRRPVEKRSTKAMASKKSGRGRIWPTKKEIILKCLQYDAPEGRIQSRYLRAVRPCCLCAVRLSTSVLAHMVAIISYSTVLAACNDVARRNMCCCLGTCVALR